ncbi:hypothetical protein JCM18237_27770 [Halorubrum luteum]
MSEASAGKITSYDWSVEDRFGAWDGDDPRPSGETVTGVYDSYGEYDIELEVTDDSGESDTITKTIIVDAERPTADFEITPSDPEPDEEFELDASTSAAPAGEITSYDWSVEDRFGAWDGDDSRPSGETVTGVYDSYGDYEIELEVTDNGGATDTISKTVTVDAERPTADFEITPSDPGPDEEFELDASMSEAPAGEITSYDWSVEDRFGAWDGDSTSPSGETVTGVYDSYGEYDIELEITDNGGATDTVSKTVTVDAERPTADFEITPSDPGPDEEFELDASMSEAPAGEITSYDWSVEDRFGAWDGDSTSPSGETVTGVYDSYGDYEIELEVTDNGGATDTISKTVTVDAERPTADFEITPSDPGPDEEFELDASMSAAPAGEITSYDWSVEDRFGAWDGDSTSPSGETVTGVYDSYGEYDIELEITDNGGATDTVSKTVTVDAERPTADFEITPSDPGPDEEFELDASMSEAPAGEITSYDWSVEDRHGAWDGDSSSPSGEKVTGLYQGVGEYEIELEVTDNGGATDSATKTIDIGGDGPTAVLDISSSAPAPNEEIVFDASDSEIPAGDTVTYDWSYETADGNDGSNSGESVAHSFENYGEFEVTLTITDEFDRSDSVTSSVSVRGEGPTADFESSPSDPELNERIVFDGSVSTEPDLTIEEYQWYINGEPQGTGSELDVVFDEAGVYNVELEVENTGGKADRVSESLRVGDEADIIDNPDFEIVRSSPESRLVYINHGETRSFISEIETEEVPDATKILYVDGEFINRSTVESKTLRTAHQFEEVGQQTVEVEVEGAAGKSDVVQWNVQTHTFNSIPTASVQSSSEVVDVDGNTEILTFSVQNPQVNNREIETEIVAELPDGISISAASGAATGDAAVQTSTETVAPGQQESMRLDIYVEDDSLDGQQLTIPYQVRFQPVGGENVTYTAEEQEWQVTVGGSQDTGNEDDSGGDSVNGAESSDEDIPGFGVISVVASLLLLIIGVRHRSVNG